MTQDERLLAKYDEIMSFMEENHRRPARRWDQYEKVLFAFLEVTDIRIVNRSIN